MSYKERLINIKDRYRKLKQSIIPINTLVEYTLNPYTNDKYYSLLITNKLSLNYSLSFSPGTKRTRIININSGNGNIFFINTGSRLKNVLHRFELKDYNKTWWISIHGS